MTTKKCKLIIYKVVNSKNGKIYVGFTKREIASRWNEHLRSARNDSELVFHRAIRKYGSESFRIEEVDSTYDPEKIGDLETFWINALGSSTFLNGYNVGAGGIGGDSYFRTLTTEQISRHNLKISNSKKGCSPKISEKTRQERSELMKVLNRNGLACKRSYFKRLIAVSPSGEISKSDSIPNFCRKYSLSYGSVLRFARGQQKKLPQGWWFCWDTGQSDNKIKEEWGRNVS